ncbi:hypothetical protein [Rhodovulum sp.]|uniref:hypothetical protein n=1 Tax=Rhodovulum sp. TaxID=34009 RepID=UPI0018043F97|nr:hypothetical protein [Rhodovulum sp.]HDR28351.1 hypothetical protein [Rhodovulum sp.]
MIPFIALFSWPLFSAFFFLRFSTPVAVVLTILVGYLVLPEKTSVDLPLLPELNKKTIPALAALVLAPLLGRSQPNQAVLPGLLPRLWTMRLLVLLLVVGAFMTVMTNGDMLRYGTTVLPALRPYDAFSYILSALMFVVPMALARKYLATPEAHRMLLIVLCVAALAYSFLILVELRMSPLMHYWVYGEFPHVWAQHVRAGGWRPVVFLGHGLLVGIFLCAAALATAGLVRSAGGRRGPFIAALLWLLVILVLSKNLGALMITLLLLPLVLLATVRVQLIAAALIAASFLTYPALRQAGLIPIDSVVAFAERINPYRAHSLQVRLKNEDAFLDKAKDRILFGWGGWGRSRTYNDEGVDVTIADGAWVITLSISGWVGYVARFGLICVPLFLLLWVRRRHDIGTETSVLALLVAGNLIDLVPNSSITPITALAVGALWGRAELGAIRSAPAQADSPGETLVRPGYFRPALARRDRAADPPAPGSAAPERQRPLNSRYTRHTPPTGRSRMT